MKTQKHAQEMAELRDAVKWLVRAEYARKMDRKYPDSRPLWYAECVVALDEAGKLACVKAEMDKYMGKQQEAKR